MYRPICKLCDCKFFTFNPNKEYHYGCLLNFYQFYKEVFEACRASDASDRRITYHYTFRPESK